MRSIAGLLIVIALAVPASAQTAEAVADQGQQHSTGATPRPPVQAVSLRAFGLISEQSFSAKTTFDGIFGSSAGAFFGGGGQVVFSNGVFAEVAVSRFSKSGQRAFRSGGETFPLGIAVKSTITPVEFTGGYRFHLRGRAAMVLVSGRRRRFLLVHGEIRHRRHLRRPLGQAHRLSRDRRRRSAGAEVGRSRLRRSVYARARDSRRGRVVEGGGGGRPRRRVVQVQGQRRPLTAPAESHVPEGGQRIELRRPSCRHVARRQRDDEQDRWQRQMGRATGRGRSTSGRNAVRRPIAGR